MPTLPKERKRPTERRRHGQNARIQTLIYNTHRWHMMKDARLQEHPICECCGQALSREVHHIIPISNAETDEKILELGYNYKNIQALCHDCHLKKHGRRR